VVLPFWQLVVPSAHYILCLRNPLDVARSLARSDGVDCGVALWLRYTRDSLEYTRGQPRLLIFYEDVLRDWRGELRRVAAFVGARNAVESASRAAMKEGIVDDQLWHHRSELADSLDDPRLTFPAKALYLSLVLSRRLQPGAAKTLPHGALESFAAAALATHAASPRREELTRAEAGPTAGESGEMQAALTELRKAPTEFRMTEPPREIQS
jgi:hypothetical protein